MKELFRIVEKAGGHGVNCGPKAYVNIFFIELLQPKTKNDFDRENPRTFADAQNLVPVFV